MYCTSCGGTLVGQSLNGAGAIDTVKYYRADSTSGDTRTLLVEVRYYSATMSGNKGCAPWSLRVTGNTIVPAGPGC